MFKALQSHSPFQLCIPIADLVSEHHEFQFLKTIQNNQRVSQCQCIRPLWSMISNLIDIFLSSIFDYQLSHTHIMITMKTKWTRDHGFEYNEYIVSLRNAPAKLWTMPVILERNSKKSYDIRSKLLPLPFTFITKVQSMWLKINMINWLLRPFPDAHILIKNFENTILTLNTL